MLSKFSIPAAAVFITMWATVRVTAQEHFDPYWPGPESPKLTTPQWIGDTGVEAAILLSIDDMREPEKYEAFCRPILNRLKEIDGRAPLTSRDSNF